MIKTAQHAAEHSARFSKFPTIVVSEKGDIHANCDIDAVCNEMEANKEKFFIVKGERSEKKPKTLNNKKPE